MKGSDFLKFLKKKYSNLLELDIKYLMEFSSKISHKDPLFYEKEFKPTKSFEKNLKELVNGKPIEYIKKESEFLGSKLYVDKNVLIPRSETEELSLIFADYIDKNYLKTVADIGTGSGCISVFLKKRFSHLNIYAVDNDKKALLVARKNFKKNNVNINCFLGDGIEPLIKNKIKLNGLICNPPYITKDEYVQESVKRYEPKKALYIPKISLYEKIFKKIHLIANYPFIMCFEMSPKNKELIEKLYNKYLKVKFNSKIEFLLDINKYNRFVRILLNNEK